MGREDFSQSSQLTTLVGKPTNRYKRLPKNVGTLKSLTQARAKPNNRLHYSAYPLIQKEYSATYTQLTNLDFYSPIITILGSNPVSHYVGTPYVDAGVKVDEGSELYSTVSTVDTSEFGTYSVVYKARDGINADTTMTRVVKVGLPPDATINGQNPVTLERYGVYTDAGITVNDSNSALVFTTSTLNNTVVGTYTVNYTVSNPAFTQVFSRTVRVDDTTPPVITITGDNPYELERFDPYVDEGATVDLGSELTNTDLSNVQNTAIGSFDVVYTAYDGNTTVTATRTVNVVDTVPPVITISNNTPQENILERFGVYVDAGATVDLGSILTVDDSAVDNTLAHNSTFDVIYSATDGNTLHDVTSTRTVTIKDTVLPVLNLIGDNPYNIQPLIDFETVDPGYSNDASTIVTVDYSQVTTGDNDIFNVTYTGDDGVHAPVVRTREVRVDDTLRPVITILGDNPYTHERFAVYTDPGATVDLGSTLIRTDNLVTANVGIVGSYYVEYEAEDGFNENTIERRIVNVVDTTAPVITLDDGDTPGSSTVTIERFSTYTDPGATADGGETVSNNASSNLNTSVVGEYWITFTATDPSGNEGRVNRRVIVEDTVAPQVTLNNASQSYTIERYSDWSTVDPGVTVDEGSYLHAVNIDTSLYGSQNVEYVVRDGTNETTILRPITIQDTVAPVITLEDGDSADTTTFTVQRGTTYTDPGATADTGESVTVNTAGLNMSVSGDYYVLYSATDAAGNTGTANRLVQVRDTIDPVITLADGDAIGSPTVTVQRGTTYTDPGYSLSETATVTDNRSSNLNMGVSGDYWITFTATDPDGNEGTATRRVIVEDTTDPVITFEDGDSVGSSTFTVQRGTTYTDPGYSLSETATVTDNRSSNLNMDVSGDYWITFTATDAAGNEGTATRKVIVEDTIDPVITLTGADPYTIETYTTYTDPGYSLSETATVTDNRSSNLNTSIASDYWITYTATDPSGNEGTATRKVTVKNKAWDYFQKILASDGAAGDEFGWSVAIDGDYAIVGAYGDNSTTDNFAGAAYIFHRTGTNTWDSGTKISPSGGAAGDDVFGKSVAIDGDYAIVGAPERDITSIGSDAGAAYIFRRTGTNTWDSGYQIVASNGAASDQFGYSVSISGDYAIVGSPWDTIQSLGANAGSAYIFRRTGTNTWDTGINIMADGTFTSQKFGISVAIDGDYAVVGAHESNEQGGAAQTKSGVAMIFHRTGANNTPNTWDTGQKIVPSDPAAYDEFGTGVAISGNTAVIGAPKDDDNSVTDSGSVYVFVRSGTTWTEQEKLTGGSGTTSGFLGHSVSISGDLVVAGAKYTSDNGLNSGAAYVFRRTGTSTWHSGTKILASWDAAAGDQFGQSVAIDGDHVIIGAHLDTDNGLMSGSAYIFHNSLTSDTIDPIITLTGANPDTVDMIPTYTEPGYSVDKVASVADNASSNLTTSTTGDYWITYTATDPHGNSGTADRRVIVTDADWDTETKIVASDAAAGDSFGYSVSISGDYAIVGAYGNDDGGSGSGSAYIFRKDTGTGTWDSGTKIVASDAAAGDGFGRAVAISGDYAIVGARGNDDGGNNSGSAYIFRRYGAVGTNNWQHEKKLTASDAAAGDSFGYSVSISGDYAIVGAYGNDDGGTNSGSAYIFHRTGTGNSLNTWDSGLKIQHTNPYTWDRFGQSVAIDGDYAIVGTDVPNASSSGTAHLFRRTTTGSNTWDLKTTISPTNGASGDRFGRGVGISGNYAIVGAPQGSSASGYSCIFHNGL